MYDFINKTRLALNLENFKVVKSDVIKFIENCTEKFDLVFAGPPYALSSINDLPVQINKYNLIADKGWFILEHTPANNYSAFPLYKTSRNYGTTIFSIFVNS